MAIGWFVCPYVVENNPNGFPFYRRRPVFHTLLAQIVADGGAWAGSECLGNHLVAKIRASEETLAAISTLDNVIRLPKTLLSQSLSDLTSQQKTAIVNKLRSLGYSLAEIRDALGNNIGDKTVGDVLRFAIKRRLTPRFDADLGIMVLDGAERPTKSINATDDEVSNI